MIPIEFTETARLQEELIRLESKFEQDALRVENPEFAERLEAYQHSSTKYELEPEEQYKRQINDSFKTEYKQLEEAQIYFLGCSNSLYTNHYESRLEAFKNSYPDAQEHNFIHDELQILINFELPNYLDVNLIKSIGYSIERNKEFLIKRLEELEFTVSFSIDKDGLETLSIKTNQKDLSISKQNISTLKWKANVTDLVELGMALIESKSINVGKGKDNLSENQFYKLLADFFKIDKLYHEKLKQDIKRRVRDETVFLPKLNDTLQKAILEQLK
ncbi:RteC domain-containing protein [Myroides fluvii]|nr:RteC domain-containing protein [Myroides fluvii]